MAADLKPPLRGYSLWLLAGPHECYKMQQLIDDLADAFDVASFKAHVTLLGLLDRTAKDVAYVQAVTQRLADEHQPFFLEVTGVGRRDMYFQSVFLTAVPSPEVMAMNAAARRYCGHESDPPFMPHFSAVYGDVAKVIKSSMRSAIEEQFQFPRRISIQRIALVDVHGAPSDWEIMEEYTLQG